MDIGWGIVLLLILVGSSAVLSTTEIAVASMEKIRLSVLIRSHPRKARALQVLMDDPNSLITTVAIVNNFANILASSIATILAIQLLGALSATEAGLIATVLMTVFLLIFGEITPKNFGKNNPEFLTLLLIGPLVALRNALGPLSFLFKSASDALLFLLPKNLRERESVTVSEDHITMLLELGQGKGLIEEEEVDMIRRIFAFDDLAARQVMVSRVDVVSIEAATSFEQARQIAIAEEHSRYPVYEEKPDNVIGILHIKDLLRPQAPDTPLRTLARSPYFIPESKPINDLLRDFQKLKQQMAIVVDEYGGMSGIVTLEDILEEIVGEILDEYDVPEEEIRPLGYNLYLVNGDTEIDRLNQELDLDLPTQEGTTIGGLILNRLEDIPDVGAALTVNGAHLLVEEASDKEIHKVRLKIIAPRPVKAER